MGRIRSLYFFNMTIGFVLALILSGCGNQDTFLAPSGIDAEVKTAILGGATVTTVPVDLVISVDTSGSMVQETDLVIANLQKFYDSLAKFSDIQVTLVMSGGTSTGKVLNLGAGQTLLPVQINSRDGPAIMIDLLNPSSSKGASVSGVKFRASRRSSAKAVFLFITDDDSNDLRFDVLNKVTDPLWPATALSEFTRLLGQKPSINGIIGHTNIEVSGIATCPGTAKTGTFYMEAAKLSGGKNWSICTQDYTALFEEISMNIKKSLESSFALPADFRYVKSVSIDGRLLLASEYTITDKKLNLLPSLANSFSAASKIKVDYI